mgnify:FL=1
MIKINQTRFGGSDSPISEQGNCFQACLASILEIPLEDAFDCCPFDTPTDEKRLERHPWWVAFNEWLSQFGLGSIWLEFKPTPPTITQLLGYHLAEVKSHTLKSGNHCVVIHDGELVHDPNPKSKVDSDDLIGVYILVPLDISKSTQVLRTIQDVAKA